MSCVDFGRLTLPAGRRTAHSGQRRAWETQEVSNMLENMDEFEGELKELTDKLYQEKMDIKNTMDSLFELWEKYSDLLTQFRELRGRLKV
jgi:DNA-binding transcriptional regulator GbsR (MarR family)